jgi:hypothetical protein
VNPISRGELQGPPHQPGRREIRQPGLERGEEGAVVGRREGVYFITTHQRREYGGDREARDDSGGTSMALFFLTV